MLIFHSARFQKEEALKFRVTKAEEIVQAEKVIGINALQNTMNYSAACKVDVKLLACFYCA